MLKEFAQVKQEPGVERRRWFEDEGMELVVWYRAGHVIEGFQLLYPGVDQRERALTWREMLGFSHAAVDAGDDHPEKNLAPVLVADGAVPWERLRREFAACSGELEAPVREFVALRLAQGAR